MRETSTSCNGGLGSLSWKKIKTQNVYSRTDVFLLHLECDCDIEFQPTFKYFGGNKSYFLVLILMF